MFNVIRPGFRKQTDFDQLVDRFFNESCRRLDLNQTPSWTPLGDFFEDESKYTLSLELPGVSRNDITIDIENDLLKISGEKKKGTETHRTERFYGQFSRVFSLPESVDRDAISAKFDQGVLTVNIPKLPASQPHKIRIE